MEELLEVAAEHGVAVEANGTPDRLVLNARGPDEFLAALRA
jgi:hypothetical protein